MYTQSVGPFEARVPRAAVYVECAHSEALSGNPWRKHGPASVAKLQRRRNPLRLSSVSIGHSAGWDGKRSVPVCWLWHAQAPRERSKLAS